MRKGSIITNAFYHTEKTVHQAERIKEELAVLGISTEICSQKSAEDINADFAVFLDKDLYLAEQLEGRGVRLFNPSKAIRICDDKMLTHIRLSGIVDMPVTLAARLRYELYEQRAEAAADFEFERAERTLGYPMVVKECFGSFGRGVRLVKSRAELEILDKQLKNTPRLYQQYIAEGAGRDIRVIAVGGRAIGAMLRVSSDGFLSNAEAGGSCRKTELTKALRLAAESAAGALKLDFCGVDFMTDKEGKPLLIEVNSNAYFKEFERTTGINTAQAFALHIHNQIYLK